jgi:hypothetical protein
LETWFVQLSIDNQCKIEQEMSAIRMLAAIGSLMRTLYLIVITFLLYGCKTKSSELVITVTKSTFIDSIRKDCRAAQVYLRIRYKPGVKIPSVIAVQTKEMKVLDSLFSFIGQEFEKKDCSFSNYDTPGTIYFYRDTAMSDVLLKLDFVVGKPCYGLFTGSYSGSRRFHITPEGNAYLNGVKEQFREIL